MQRWNWRPVAYGLVFSPLASHKGCEPIRLEAMPDATAPGRSSFRPFREVRRQANIGRMTRSASSIQAAMVGEVLDRSGNSCENMLKCRAWRALIRRSTHTYTIYVFYVQYTHISYIYIQIADTSCVL